VSFLVEAKPEREVRLLVHAPVKCGIGPGVLGGTDDEEIEDDLGWRMGGMGGARRRCERWLSVGERVPAAQAVRVHSPSSC
jgi:hypothetical protein